MVFPFLFIVRFKFAEHLFIYGSKSSKEGMGIGLFLGLCCSPYSHSIDRVPILHHTILFLNPQFPYRRLQKLASDGNPLYCHQYLYNVYVLIPAILLEP